jgi:nucleoside-diphosphate-sugar epimerase
MHEMQNTRNRLLIVGGNGFIGRHTVAHALALGWDVTSLGISPQPQIGKRSTGVRYLTADIADGSALKAALGSTAFEYVVNCGGYIDHAGFFSGGRRAIDVHFLGVLNLVETLDRGILRAFVNMGSSDEYGSTSAPQSEAQREQPISSYSSGKVAATHFLQMLSRTENYPATTLRLFITYGPGQDQRRFLPQIIMGCLEGRMFPASKGEQLRDFCFVGDTVAAIFAALTKRAAAGEVINVASGEPVSIREVIEKVRRLIGKGEPNFGQVAYRPGENMALYANIGKAKAILGWEPAIPLEAGLKLTIESLAGKA